MAASAGSLHICCDSHRQHQRAFLHSWRTTVFCALLESRSWAASADSPGNASRRAHAPRHKPSHTERTSGPVHQSDRSSRLSACSLRISCCGARLLSGGPFLRSPRTYQETLLSTLATVSESILGQCAGIRKENWKLCTNVAAPRLFGLRYDASAVQSWAVCCGNLRTSCCRGSARPCVIWRSCHTSAANLWMEGHSLPSPDCSLRTVMCP